MKVEEGDGNDPVTASIDFDIVGELTRPAKLVVMTVGQARGAKEKFTLDLAPGQTSGSVPVSYQPDNRDDYPRAVTQVAAWATRNVMTDSYTGSLTVLDDDPTPAMTVRAGQADRARRARRPSGGSRWLAASTTTSSSTARS